MVFDVDKGLRGLVVHHEPMTNLQLKRLLLVFDEIHMTPPDDNRFFLEKGAISYYYKNVANQKILYSVDGLKLLDSFKNVSEPDVPKDSLPIANVLNYGGSKDKGIEPYQAIVMSDILPYFKNHQFEKEELILLDRFEKAVDKKHIQILDYKNSDFYLRNSISLKIAYDFDVSDNRSLDHLKYLFVKEKTEGVNMFIPSPAFPEMTDFKYFPQINYNSSLQNDKEGKEYDYERQYFSIIGKVNKKLALSNDYNLIPIFINQRIHDYFRFKVLKSTENEDPVFNEEWKKNYDSKLINLSNLLFQSSNVFLNNDRLDKISIPEIVSYKERCLDDLYRLRKNLFGEINNIVGSDYTNSDSLEIKTILERKIIPEFGEYQRSQNQILGKVLKNITTYGISFGSAYVGFVQGLSPLLIATLSGLSPKLADDLLQLSGKLADKKKRKYENTFSYFLNMNKNR
jgi:hypothetical protein